jgi:hypothetical protein
VRQREGIVKREIREWVDLIFRRGLQHPVCTRKVAQQRLHFFHVVYHISSPWKSDENEEGEEERGKREDVPE